MRTETVKNVCTCKSYSLFTRLPVNKIFGSAALVGWQWASFTLSAVWLMCRQKFWSQLHLSVVLEAGQVSASYCGLKLNIFSFHTSFSGAIDRMAFVRTIYFHLPPPLLSTSIIINSLFLYRAHSSLTILASSSLGNWVFQALSRLFARRAGFI